MANWTGKSRGTVLGYQIVVFFLRTFGLGRTYSLLRLISFYYFLFARGPRRVIQDFYQHRLGKSKEEAKQLCRENFDLLAQSILDKMALSMGYGKEITYTQKGEEELVRLAKAGEGGFLFSAHLGNWDIAGSLLINLDIPVNVVMLQNEEKKLGEFLERIGSKPFFKIIPIKNDLSHLLQIYQAYKRKELVCINADRFLPGNKTIELPFLNGVAPFPEGPFELVNKLKAPYACVFAVKSGRFEYSFSSTPPKKSGEGVEAIAREYVREFEKKVRQYPEQWFNYYDFYQKHS